MKAATPRWVRALALAASFGALACGGADVNPANREVAGIYGGSRVPDDRFRSVVALPTCTGILVAPSVVVYAAHCGVSWHEVTFGSDATVPERRASLTRCRAHPDAALGNGRDVAYCLLVEPVLDLPPLELLDDEQAAAVAVGTEVREVGYGLASDEGVFGTKRESSGTVVTLGDDLVIVGTDAGTCSGDSGGPALVRIDEGEGEESFRALGILSAGTSFECGVSTDHYTNLRSVQGWLEEETGVKLGAGGSSAPRATAEPAPACQLSARRGQGRSDAGGFVAAVLLGGALFGMRRSR